LQALGTNLGLSGNHHEAAKVLNELMSRFPEHHEGYILLAQAYKAAGDMQLAWQSLSRLAKTRPEYPMIHVTLAQSLVEAGPSNRLAALEALKKAEMLSPADGDVYLLRGKIFLSMGRYEDGIAALLRAVELQPNTASNHYQLGIAYQRAGQVELAREEFERMEHLKQLP
jgi:predicted Zn-dependent protease